MAKAALKNAKEANQALSSVIGVANSVQSVNKYSSVIMKNMPIIGAVGGLITVALGIVESNVSEVNQIKSILQQHDQHFAEMKQQLTGIAESIEKLSDLTSQGFEDLKVFIAEQNFYRDFGEPIGSLTMFLCDAICNPNRHSVGIFRDRSAARPPLDLAYNFINRLKTDQTNPLKMAMKADSSKKRSTFDKWRNIIDCVLGQLLLLETMVDGMFWGQNGHGPRQLEARINNLNSEILEWCEELREAYWPNVVEKSVKRALKNYGSKEKVADAIKNDLDQVYTNDAFWIIVMTTYPVAGTDNFVLWGYKNQRFQAVEGKVKVIVFRSKRWDMVSEQERIDFEQAVFKIRKDYPEEDFNYFTNFNFNSDGAKKLAKYIDDELWSNIIIYFNYAEPVMRGANCYNRNKPGQDIHHPIGKFGCFDFLAIYK